jgi:hypothetical protein
MKFMGPELAKYTAGQTAGKVLLGVEGATGCQMGERYPLKPGADYSGALSNEGEGFEAVGWQVVCSEKSYGVLAGTSGPDHKVVDIRAYEDTVNPFTR